MESTLTDPSTDPYPFELALRERISAHLAVHPRTEIRNPDLRRAAVAITVVESERGAGFVLTRRDAGLRAHSHQYALPGGRIDDGEDAIGAARRELEEEVALTTDPDHVLGVLDDYRTRSGYVITPVVIWSERASTMMAQPGEVEAIFVIDLDELDRPDSPRWIDIAESDLPVIQLPIRNRLIHAPTGALLYQFGEVGMHGRLARTDQVEEPTWAWR